MALSEADRRLVERVGEAMQAGAEGEEEMMSLFAEDGVLVEPFNGPQTHSGKAAVQARYKEMVSMPRPPDFTLTTNKIWVEGDKVMSEWTCSSSVFPAPMLGRDEYIIENGLIKRLEITVLQGPA